MQSIAANTNDFHVSVPLVYIETTIPAGMTIAEYRASRVQPKKRFRRLGRR